MIQPLKNRVKIERIADKSLEEVNGIIRINAEFPYFKGTILGIGSTAALKKPDGTDVLVGENVYYDKGGVVEFEEDGKVVHVVQDHNVAMVVS